MNILIIFIFLVFALVLETSVSFKLHKVIKFEKQSYASLENSYDGIREFKHDFSNIMQSIGGYLSTDDLNGLKSYYASVFKECNDIKKLSILNKEVFNSPPVLSLISSKFYKAKELGIDINIEALLDFSTINMDIYEFTRILGIFLDNSIEAAANSSKKNINVFIYKDVRNHFDAISIENSCDESCIDTSKIFDKDFSTKPKNMGLGLWKVKKILGHYDNVKLRTSISNNMFRQQLQIYY